MEAGSPCARQLGCRAQQLMSEVSPSQCCMVPAESQEGPSAAFGALVKDYMQRPPPAAPAQAGADFAQHCHRLEHQSSQAVKTVTVQQSKSQRDQKEPVCQQRPPNKLEAAIASASQASSHPMIAHSQNVTNSHSDIERRESCSYCW